MQELETFNPYVDPARSARPDLQLRMRVPAASPSRAAASFTVRRGDTFASIARKTGHSMQHLPEINRTINARRCSPASACGCGNSASGARYGAGAGVDRRQPVDAERVLLGT